VPTAASRHAIVSGKLDSPASQAGMQLEFEPSGVEPETNMLREGGRGQRWRQCRRAWAMMMRRDVVCATLLVLIVPLPHLESNDRRTSAPSDRVTSLASIEVHGVLSLERGQQPNPAPRPAVGKIACAASK